MVASYKEEEFLWYLDPNATNGLMFLPAYIAGWNSEKVFMQQEQQP